MAETRKTGAGSLLGSVLERAPQPRPEPAEVEGAEAEPAPKGRGGAPTPKAAKVPAARTTKKIKGRTVYIPDDLYERIIVQAHRRDITNSDYICLLLERHVPDHRVVRSGPVATAEPGDGEAA